MDRQTAPREAFYLMLKEPERGIKMLKENREIPHFFFLPSILPYHSSKTSPTGVYRIQNSQGGLTLHLKELRAQEDGQTPFALFPLPSCHLAQM